MTKLTMYHMVNDKFHDYLHIIFVFNILIYILHNKHLELNYGAVCKMYS